MQRTLTGSGNPAGHGTGPWGIVESSSLNYLKELHRLEKQNVIYKQKIEEEKVIKQQLDEEYAIARKDFNKFQSSTRNGFAVKEDDAEYRKILARLETQLESSNVKLSSATKANHDLKQKIDDLRKTKIMNLKISRDLTDEYNKSSLQIANANKEITAINDRRYKIKNEITNVRHQMVQDIESFTEEVSKAKQVVDSAQAEILDTIRDRIKTASNMTTNRSSFMSSLTTTTRDLKQRLLAQDTEAVVMEGSMILNETGALSLEAFFDALEASEVETFELYQMILDKDKIRDGMEADCRGIQQMVEKHEGKIAQVKEYKEKKKQELDEQITVIQEAIGKYQEEYDMKMGYLKSVSEDLMLLLKNIALGDEALDQQLLSTGIYDRNMGDFLGLVEQRIDELIQMTKAVENQTIRREDFIMLAEKQRYYDSGMLQEPPKLDLAEAGLGALVEEDDDHDADSPSKVSPVNIQAFKKIVEKKLNNYK